jgi:asparagine synthase (glutamine-hydrolysing)
MSGIVVSYGDQSDEEVLEMLGKLEHRGPNSKTLINNSKITFGKTHFSPEQNENEYEKQIVLDGRIYNRGELLNDAKSDEELIIKLYEKEGPAFLKKLNGMFSFVMKISDGNFIAARDPLGVKPLYYGKKGNNLLFASELKALVGYTDSINYFPPASYYTPQEGFVKYIDLQDASWKKTDLDNALNKLKNLVEESVIKQIPQNTVPASLLSGGLDSTIIASVLSKKIDNLKTYCVGMERANDLKAARNFADFIGSEHKEFIYSKEDIKDILPKVIYHMESFDPSLIRSSVANYFAYNLIENDKNIIFSGEGSDELFGGYTYLKDYEKNKLHEELLNFFGSIHNVGLQRVDRMSAAHSKECRMPFLDMDLIKYASELPPEWKIHGSDKIEKWIIREAFTGDIPEDILWRTKQEFSQGSGTVDVMSEIAQEEISDKDFEKEKNVINPPLRTKEEVMNYRIFREYFDDNCAVDTVGRWVTA